MRKELELDFQIRSLCAGRFDGSVSLYTQLATVLLHHAPPQGFKAPKYPDCMYPAGILHIITEIGYCGVDYSIYSPPFWKAKWYQARVCARFIFPRRFGPVCVCDFRPQTYIPYCIIQKVSTGSTWKKRKEKLEIRENKRNATPRLFSVRLLLIIKTEMQRTYVVGCEKSNVNMIDLFWNTSRLTPNWKGIVSRGFRGQLLRGPMIVRFKRKSPMHDGEERGALWYFVIPRPTFKIACTRMCVVYSVHFSQYVPIQKAPNTPIR